MTQPIVSPRYRSEKSPAQKPVGPVGTLATYGASPFDRISLIRRGVRAVEVKALFAEMRLGQASGFKALNLSAATVNKKAQRNDVLSPEESERVIGLISLIGQVKAMVEESGDSAGFDAAAWLGRWLTEPLRALGGVCPAELLDTMAGQELVSATLAKMQSGAYA